MCSKIVIVEDIVDSITYWNSDSAQKQHLESSFMFMLGWGCVDAQMSQADKEASCGEFPPGLSITLVASV